MMYKYMDEWRANIFLTQEEADQLKIEPDHTKKYAYKIGEDEAANKAKEHLIDKIREEMNFDPHIVSISRANWYAPEGSAYQMLIRDKAPEKTLAPVFEFHKENWASLFTLMVLSGNLHTKTEEKDEMVTIAFPESTFTAKDYLTIHDYALYNGGRELSVKSGFQEIV